MVENTLRSTTNEGRRERLLRLISRLDEETKKILLDIFEILCEDVKVVKDVTEKTETL